MNKELLFQNNIKLVYKVYAEKVHGKSYASSIEEDLIQTGMMCLWKCCSHFDESRGNAFSTYAYSAIYKNMMCMLVRERKKHGSVISLNKSIKDSYEGSPLTYEDIIASPVDIEAEVAVDDLVDKITSKLGNTTKKVIHMVRQGHSQVDIAKELNVTRSYVGKILNRFRKILKDTLFLQKDEYNRKEKQK